MWWHWRLMQNLKENYLVLPKMTWGIWQKNSWNRLKNSDFILKSKIAELNQNKNSKQLEGPDAVRKLYFNFEINELHNWQNFYTCSTESLLLRYETISKHIFLGHDDFFWKINVRILWNHTMKNFQLKHGQCDSTLFPQNILFWKP